MDTTSSHFDQLDHGHAVDAALPVGWASLGWDRHLPAEVIELYRAACYLHQTGGDLLAELIDMDAEGGAGLNAPLAARDEADMSIFTCMNARRFIAGRNLIRTNLDALLLLEELGLLCLDGGRFGPTSRPPLPTERLPLSSGECLAEDAWRWQRLHSEPTARLAQLIAETAENGQLVCTIAQLASDTAAPCESVRQSLAGLARSGAFRYSTGPERARDHDELRITVRA